MQQTLKCIFCSIPFALIIMNFELVYCSYIPNEQTKILIRNRLLSAPNVNSTDNNQPWEKPAVGKLQSYNFNPTAGLFQDGCCWYR